MSISDDFIKKILGESPKNKQSSQQSKKKSGSIADDFISKHNYDVDDSFINTFLSDANRYVNSAYNDYSNVNWGNASSSYESRSNDWADLNYRTGIVKGWLDTNKDKLDEKTYKEYSAFLEGLRTSGSEIVGTFSEAKNYYSKWETEDAYFKDAAENREARQKQYEDNKKRIEELMSGASVDDLLYGNVREEIERLAAENQKYERGEGGYRSKVVDDYFGVTQSADFETGSANRNHGNPTRDELTKYDALIDSSTWYYDENDILRDAYGNEIVKDASGNLVSPEAHNYTVKDRLGIFLSATDRDIEEYMGTIVSGTWGNIIGEGLDGSWDQLYEDEIDIYYYLLNTSGQETADKYLADMKTELNRRETMQNIGQWHDSYDEATFLEKIALNAATIPAKFFSSGVGFIEDTVNTIKGEDINPYSFAHSGMHYSQTVRGDTATELDDTGFKIPLIDFTLGDIYQTGMSRIDSALATSVFGGGGTIFLGMGAAEEEAYKLYQQGASAEQITLGAFSAGAAEAFFEYVSYGKLKEMEGKDIDTIGKWVKSVLIQGYNEASEETLTEISNIITNALVMGSQSDLAELYKENEESALALFGDLLKQTTHAAFGGFIGGFGAGATQATGGYLQNTSQYRDAGNTIRSADGGAKALENLAMDVAGATEGKLSNSIKKQAGNVSGEVATGKGIGKIGAAVKNFSRDVQAGRLYNTVRTANNTLNKADVATILEMRKFDSATANELADAIVAVASGKQITEQQAALLKEYENNEDVIGVINGYDLDERSTIGKRNKAMSEFNRDIKTGLVVSELKSTTAKAFTPDGKFKVSKTGEATKLETEVDVNGKTITKDTGDVIDIKRVYDVRKVEADGKEKVELVLELSDGSTINAENVAYATQSDALIYETIANLGENINAETANRLISKYDGSNAEIFARGMAQAYTYGFYGIDRSEMTGRLSLATELTEEQRNFAYGIGEKYRGEKDARDKENARDNLAEKIKDGKAKAPGEKGVYYRDKDGNSVSIEDYLKNSNVVLKTDAQRTGIEAMRKLAETLGVRINVFESWKENGKTYYLNQNGKKVEGNPNGFYDTITGEIYIALDAGSDYSGTMLFTIAHELTHFMRQWSPEHFTEISKIVFAQSGFKGDVSAMIALKQKNAKEKGKPISYDVAMEEVVADAMETILKDGKVFEFMQELKQQNRSAWEKVKGWFKNLAKFLRKMVAAYSGKTANSVEGRKLAAFSKDLLNQIEQIWAEGAVSAGENYQEAIDGYKAEQEQFSTDTIRGNADGAVVQSEATTSIVAKEQPRTEYEAFPKQIMNLSDGAGTILDFIEGLTPTKVKGLAGKGINGYTGRDVRGYAMGISGFTQAQIKAVNKFMDTMADFMEEAGVTYKFIGLQDVENAQLHYTYNADGSIKSIVLSAMVKNGDYPVNFDLSSICKKRVAMSKLIDKLAKRGSLDNGTVKLTPANIFKINTALKDAGYETACLGCFVESKRYNSLEWAKKFCDKWNAAVKKVNPNATYFGYGDATFSEDSFTLEQAIKIDDAANKYIKATKTERLANALEKYKAKEQAGQPLVTSISKAALDRLRKSDTISDELKTKYLNCDPTTLNMADVEFLLENGILPGAALSNKQAVTEMVKSGEAYQHLLRPSDLLTDRGISKLEALPNFHGVLYGHYGSGTPKLMQSYTPYNSEIALLPASKGEQSLAEYLYTIAGVRMQSFSDFQIQNIYDYLQMVGDLAARKVPAHAYTKELPFAKLLGMTGVKVNLSVMFDIDPMVDKAHAGLTKLNKLVHRGEYAKVVLEDEQGKWVYNIGDYQTQKMFAEAFPDEAKRFLQSIGFADAVKLQSSTGYSANCGIIGVGYSDLGIFAMLNDNRIRYIIPYHASSLPAEIKVATHIALGTDYTPYQNNMKIKEIVDRNGNKVNWTIKEAYKRLGSGQAVINELNEKIRTEGWVVTTSKAQTGHGSYGLYENLQETNDPRQTASNFMDWCIGNSTLPLFYQFASHENYYKLIYDYNVYDCVTEEYAPQQAVTNTYPTMVDGQVQPGNVIDGGFNAEYFKETIDKQMAFMDEYSRNLDEDLESLAENMEEGNYSLFSDRDFSYKELTAKNPLKGRIIDKNRTVKLTNNGSIDRDWVVSEVLKQCESIQTKAPAPTYFVNVPDIGKNVEIVGDAIRHGFIKFQPKNGKPVPPKSLLNARVSLDLPHILRNSIEVNRSDRGDNAQVEFSHVLIGVTAIESSNGTIEYCVVRSVVEARKNQGAILTEANVIGKLHAMNAKKIGQPRVQAGTNSTNALAGSSLFSYSVADLLNDVKHEFDDTFSNDVYKHFGMTRRNSKFSPFLLFSDRVTDRETLGFLNEQLKNGEVTEVYRAMAKDDDGNLYPPMAGYIRKNGKKVINGQPSVIREWEQSTESIPWETVDEDFLIGEGFKQYNPTKEYPNGRFEKGNTIFYRNKDGEWKAQFHLDKDNGETLHAAYAPYIHTSLSVLNDQFTSAYTRENLVVVRGYVPNSEVYGVNGERYHAKFADKPVGKTKWHSGVVAAQMPETRTVILSRYFMPIEIVDDAVFAKKTKEMMKGKDIEIPFNVVTPRQRRALEAIGVRIGEARGLRDAPKKADVKYSDRDSNTMSDRAREILANAKPKMIGKSEKADIVFDTVRELFNELNADKDIQALADRVFDVAKDDVYGHYGYSSYPGEPKSHLRLPMAFVGKDGIPDGVHGQFRKNTIWGDIIFSYDYFMDDSVTPQSKASTILHEVIHAVTCSYIENAYNWSKVKQGQWASPTDLTDFNGVDERIKAGIELIDVFEQVKFAPTESGKQLYGQLTAYEMVAEMANVDFRNFLKKQNLWNRIVDAIKRIFGIPKTTAYDAVSDALERILASTTNDADAWRAKSASTTRYSDRILMGSLFSGGGTLEAGLVYQMLDKEFAVEYNKQIAATYTDNHGKEHMFVGDVRDFDSKDKQNVFYLHASPVCKSYSPANHSGGEKTLDIVTAQATARVLEEQMPQVFTVENVKRYIGSEAYRIITDKLTELGYTWDVDVYKASDYGNATKRERMIIRAVKDGDLPAKPAKVSGITSWGEATRDLWETDLIPSTLVKSKIEAIRNTPALKNLKLTKLDRPLMIYDTNKSKQVTYAWADELAPTLTTKCGDARIIMPDGRVYEPTPKFMGRIQGLPDDYKYPKAKTNAFKIIGNGIPTQLTKAVIGGVLDSAYEQTHDGQVLYQDRAEDSVSNRSLLANALEGVAKPEELQKIQEYKDKVALINAEEKKLRELNEQIKELSFAKGPRDNDRIKALRFDANQTANRINTYDKQLLRLEASKPLQDVLDREKKKAYQRAEKRGKEALDAYREKAAKTQRALLEKWQESRKKAVESREKTAMKHKIQSVVGELNQLLLNDDKKRHVPDSLKKAVADALALVNMDTVGAEERAAKYAALIAKETDPDKIDAYTVTMENILRQGEKMGQRLKELRDAYEEIQNSDDPDIANGYDPVISGCIKELAESIGNTSLKDMSIEQLEDVYSMYKMVLTRVRDANKSLIESIKENISSRASAVIGQVRDVGGEHKDRASILDPVRAFFWNNAKPVYAMERIGSSAFTEAFNNVRKGEDTWAKDVTEARAYYLDKSNKYGYDSWDFDKKYAFESTSGIEFELTLEQMMALYAYSKRDQAFEHLRLGGFVFDSNIETYKETVEEKDGKVKQKKSILKYKVNTADAHQLTPETLTNIISTIEKEAPGAKDFVDEMQDYLSTVMGAKGNEVTMKMYGVKLFKEKFYFPLKSAKQFMFEQNEVSGEVKIKNSGFTNKTKPKANNPIILNNFMDVWANHVNDMSMYHSFVLPLEDFNRIFNYNSPKKEGVPPVSVKGTIQSAYSPAAVSYVKQLITDLNGGAMSDPRETFAKTMMSKFKKAKVFSSLSVVIQQPSAIGRAFALVDPKYFRPTKDGMNHEELWSELKQYAPVAVIKEMGYFDTNMGKSTLDFIKAKEYSTFKEKAKAIFTDEGYRDEKLSRLPALADELTWCAIWNAVKRETVSTHKDLRPGSEEFLKVAGERFTEVVTKTQVYDSVLARSANMRSKSGLMSMVTSFMAEPTTSINMLEDAILKGKRGNKRYASRAFAAVAVSVILNNALVALVYGARDDDDDETFAEKYMQAFVSGMIDDLNPLTYYPYLKDMWSLLQGYDIERADMSLVSDLADAMKGMVKAYTSEDGDVVGAWHDLAGTIANIGGVPMQNINREINGAFNFFETAIEDANGRETTWGSMGDALEDTVKNSLPVVGWFPSETKADKLYDAIISGDTAYVNRLKGSYKTEDAYHNAVRKALRENDPRIKEAAIAGYNGNPSERVRIAKLIIADGFDQDDVVAAINAEVNDMKPDEPSEPKKKGFYTASDFAAEIANGDQATAYVAKEDIIATAQKNGKTAEEAKKSFVSSAKTELKKLFKAGTISEQKLIDTLVNFCDMEYDDAEKYAGGAAFEVAHPELDGVITYTQYQRWESDGQTRGVPLEMFVDVANFRDDGTSNSVKSQEEVALYISSVTSDPYLRDALWCCFYNESTLKNAPWH